MHWLDEAPLPDSNEHGISSSVRATMHWPDEAPLPDSNDDGTSSSMSTAVAGASLPKKAVGRVKNVECMAVDCEVGGLC
jgi:hypothetical protein